MALHDGPTKRMEKILGGTPRSKRTPTVHISETGDPDRTNELDLIKIELSTYNLELAERHLIEHLLTHYQGRSSQWYAAKLGITPRTYYRKLEKHNIVKVQGLSLQKSIHLLQQHGFEISKIHERVLNTQEPTADDNIQQSQFSVRNLQTSEVLHKTESEIRNMFDPLSDVEVFKWLEQAKVGHQMTYFSERITKLS